MIRDKEVENKRHVRRDTCSIFRPITQAYQTSNAAFVLFSQGPEDVTHAP